MDVDECWLKGECVLGCVCVCVCGPMFMLFLSLGSVSPPVRFLLQSFRLAPSLKQKMAAPGSPLAWLRQSVCGGAPLSHHRGATLCLLLGVCRTPAWRLAICHPHLTRGNQPPPWWPHPASQLGATLALAVPAAVTMGLSITLARLNASIRTGNTGFCIYYLSHRCFPPPEMPGISAG